MSFLFFIGQTDDGQTDDGQTDDGQMDKTNCLTPLMHAHVG